MVYTLLSILAAYLLGSIPTAYIFGKVLKGIDIRDYGSGNVGATNVVRAVGKIPGIIVLVLDILKGAAAVVAIPLVFQKFFPGVVDFNETVRILLGSAVIAGHIWTVFLRFKGGKGVATTAGVIAALSPVIFLSGLVVWVITFVAWKYVSLASIMSSVALPAVAVLTGKKLDFVVFCAVLCLVGVYAHRGNIKRLIQGTETKIVKDKKASSNSL